MADAEPRRGSIPRPHGEVPIIEEMDDFTESINILCHGDTGSGKNVLWGSLEDMLILAIEEGTISSKRHGSTAKVMKIRTWPQFVATYEWLRDGKSMKVGGKTYKADDFKYVATLGYFTPRALPGATVVEIETCAIDWPTPSWGRMAVPSRE